MLRSPPDDADERDQPAPMRVALVLDVTLAAAPGDSWWWLARLDKVAAELRQAGHDAQTVRVDLNGWAHLA